MANHLLRFGMLAKLFFYHRWSARAILFVSIPVALLMHISKKFIDMGNWEPVFNGGALALSIGPVIIYATMMLMTFPALLMSLVSSRQYGLLPHIRRYLAGLIFCVLLLLQLVAYCLLVFGMKANSVEVLHPLLVLAVMLTVSLVVMIPFVQLGSMQFIYIFILPVLWGYVVPLLDMPDFILGAILVFIWAIFLSWWFGWHPKKHHKYLFAMNAEEIKNQNLNLFFGFFSRSAAPQNLSAGVLFGQFGNSFYQTKLVLLAWLLAGVIFALIAMLSGRDVRDGLLVCMKITMAIQLMHLGYNYSFELFKNFNKIWLYFLLDRKQLFNFIEIKVWKLYLKNLVVVASIVVVISLCIPKTYLPLSNIASYMLAYLLASLLSTPLSLSVAFIVYAKWRGNSKIFHWVNGISMLLLSGAGLLGLEFANKNGIEHYLGQLLAIVLVLMVIIVVTREYSKRLWQKVDLVRVAN